jgi:hypothetical protein
VREVASLLIRLLTILLPLLSRHTPVGHAFVVKALLQGDLEVIDGKIIDHVGMLD